MPTDEPDGGPAGADPAPGARPYASGYHAPVLCIPVVDALVTDPAGVYVDATLGGGGHTAALLDRLAPAGRVVGIDQDEAALAAARTRLAPALEAGRFLAVRGNFGDLEALLAEAGFDTVDGLLLDLGISSHQIDVPERGFSYAAAGPLDMRMDRRRRLTAHEIVNTWEAGALRRVLQAYGDEPRAAQVARAIVQARPLETTEALAAVVRAAVPTREEVKTLARVFQALRIAVNEELAMLEQVLAAAARVLRPGGRIAVISYHSLEDRRVKRVFRHGNLAGRPVRDLYGNPLTPWRELTHRPVTPPAEEVAANPRARSARLRVAERTEAPPDVQAHPAAGPAP